MGVLELSVGSADGAIPLDPSSPVSETLNTYSHLWPGDEDRTRLTVDRALGSAEAWLRTDTGT
jgi:hypothetical protein